MFMMADSCNRVSALTLSLLPWPVSKHVADTCYAVKGSCSAQMAEQKTAAKCCNTVH
uniref:Uncharacterized protein n=1 Tax=Octopus bimaculoides TaxID=37653 RepID=A0A0L8G3I6_OCTBM